MASFISPEFDCRDWRQEISQCRFITNVILISPHEKPENQVKIEPGPVLINTYFVIVTELGGQDAFIFSTVDSPERLVMVALAEVIEIQPVFMRVMSVGDRGWVDDVVISSDLNPRGFMRHVKTIRARGEALYVE